MDRGPMMFTSDVDVAVRIVLSLLVGYPKWKVRCSTTANFP